MKIIVNKEEVNEIQTVIDSMLKNNGLKALQMANKMISSVQIEEETQEENKPQGGIVLENTKVI